MNPYWGVVLIAAFFEVIWVTGLKYATSPLEWLLTMLAIFISFWGLIFAGKKISASIVYIIFVGLGTVGTVITEMIWFGIAFDWRKIVLIFLLLVGIIGLNVISNTEEKRRLEGEKV